MAFWTRRAGKDPSGARLQIQEMKVGFILLHLKDSSNWISLVAPNVT